MLVRVGWRKAIAMVGVAVISAAAACSPAGSESGTESQAATGLSVLFATPDIALGRHRVAFVLSDRQALVRLPIVKASSFHYPAGYGAPEARSGPIETVNARYNEFPLGTRAIYVAELEFESVGDWHLEISVPRPDGTIDIAEISFEIPETTRAPAVGDRPPPSVSRTLADVAGVHELTTGSEPDPELYRVTLAEALSSGKPSIVTFTSPAFCTTAICGPQDDVLSELRQRYHEQASFIHVDLYENPHELQGDLDRAVRTGTFDEWGLDGDQWTFVMDREGRVHARYQSFVTIEELEQALLSALDGVSS